MWAIRMTSLTTLYALPPVDGSGSTSIVPDRKSSTQFTFEKVYNSKSHNPWLKDIKSSM